MTNVNPCTIFISAAEQSADEHAAALIREFTRLRPGARFCGLAGPAMRAAGCDCLEDLTTRSAMAAAAFRRVPEAWLLLRRLKTHLGETPYDAAVMVDSPALNLPIAKLCRSVNLPVLYYIAPQTWAWGWRWWRNRRIRARVDQIACIWPFEEAYFREADIPATFVGHPSFDRLLSQQPDPSRIAELRGSHAPVVTLLPGSRRHVVDEVLPGQLEAAAALQIRYPKARFLIVAANSEARARIEQTLATRKKTLQTLTLMGDADRAAAIVAADFALVASGTVTLEVAYHGTPMIVMYNAGRWSYHLLGRWLITTPHLSLPNILAGRRIVPEFMPYFRSADPIIATAIEWLASPSKLERVRHDLHEIIQPLAREGAAQCAAAQLARLIDAASSSRQGRSSSKKEAPVA
ncbi:MAG TPA: lipid-A-disaccharide synthase [Phycisphaerae bacterium]|nr:lipid-A-disaccharide synthase [Phycisphaerae bacterium]